jgi:hypothetical protein
MRVVLIGKTWPEPTSSAAGKRTMDLIEACLEAGWELIFASSAEPTKHSVQLDEIGVTEKSVVVNDSSFDSWIAEVSPRMVVFDRFMTEEQFGWRVEKACPDAIRILDTSDLHCLRRARGEQLKHGGDLNLFNEIALREIASIFRSDLTLMISETEIEILKEIFEVPDALLFYLPLMSKPGARKCVEREGREHFAMIGNYLHDPNWDAVRWCCHEIWPSIKRSLPEAELHIYGAYETEKARQLESAKLGIHLKGRAENALETLERYRVNLAPLRYGAGQKGKVLDGWMSGTPTVATPIAAESMNGLLEWGCAVTNDPEQFAETAARVYCDAMLWHAVQEQGYKILRERFRSDQWRPRLIAALDRRVPAKRAENFIGQMLRHHYHRSTEFMSRWIELKSLR